MLKKFLIVLSIIVIIIAGSIYFFKGDASNTDKISLKLAHGLSVNHPVHKAMQYFADEIAKQSNNEVTVTIFPNGQLGQERELIELTQVGAIDITKASASPLESFSYDYSVFSVPYLFRDKNHFVNSLRGNVGEEILESSSQRGVKGLAYYDSGTRSFYSNKAINTPQDVKGLKIRVQLSPTSIKMIEVFGGQATPLSFGEVYTALSQNVVDGAENNVTSLVDTRHGEVVKYYSYDEHTMVPDVLLISTATWDKLSDKHKDIIKKAALKSSEYQFILWEKAEADARKAAVEMGVTFLYPKKSPFVAKAQPIIDEFAKDNRVKNLITQIISLK